MSASKAKKVRKHKSENRGNFSSFRNKSFVPNASKVGKRGAAEEDANEGNESDDDNEEDNEG